MVVRVFQKDGSTSLLFPYSSDVKQNMGKLDVEREKYKERFGSSWLSDYAENE